MKREAMERRRLEPTGLAKEQLCCEQRRISTELMCLAEEMLSEAQRRNGFAWHHNEKDQLRLEGRRKSLSGHGHEIKKGG